MDNVTNPALPQRIAELHLDGLVVTDIRILDPIAKTLVVVISGNNSALKVISYDLDTLTVITPSGSGLLPSPFLPGGGADFKTLGSVEIHPIHDGLQLRRLAFCGAGMNYVVKHPGVTGIVVCDLTNPAAPQFLQGSNQYYDPVPPDSPPSTGTGSPWKVNDLVIVEDAGQHLLYAACGNERQLKVFNVTNVLTTGMVDTGLGLPDQNRPFYAVAAERNLPAAGQDYLYLMAQGGIYAVPRTNLGAPVLVNTDTGNEPPQRDVLAMLEDQGGQDRRTFWTMVTRQVDYKWKITDVTQNDLTPDVPVVEDKRYASGGADGGVAVLAWDAVYMPSFGGVVRFDISTGEGIPADDSYQPALNPATNVSYPTEHLELVDFGTTTPDHWLIAPTAVGSFIAWDLDEQAPHDPGGPQFFAPGPGYWPWAAGIYGDDIAVGFDSAGDRIVLFDYHKLGGNPELAIGRYNWDDGNWLSPILFHDAVIDPNARDLTVDGNWLFVGAENGFFVADIEDGEVDDLALINTNEICGRGLTRVEGIARFQDRVFVSLSDGVRGPNGDRFAVAMYSFDIDHVTGKAILGQSAEQCLFDGAGTPPTTDAFPGVHVDGGGRLRLFQISTGLIRLYTGTGTGHILELEYAYSTDQLSAMAFWHNDHHYDAVLDNQIYAVGEETGPGFGPGIPDVHLRILVAKWMETFALVEGSPLQ